MSKNKTFEIEVDVSELSIDLEDFKTKAHAALEMYAETEAKSLEGYAKANRPWTDRTGDARKRLTGSVEKNDSGLDIILAHGVDYGIWLELAHEKRFAIVEPTIRRKSPVVVRGLNRLLKGISSGGRSR